MNQFEKQRIADAIMILELYEDLIRDVAKECEYHEWDCDNAFSILNNVRKFIGD